MSIMAKTPSGYKKIGSAYLGERPVDKVFNANGDVVYALQRELTGVPPLLFKGKEQSELLNYRIYGDTVDGESVGDRTGNLFDETWLNGNWYFEKHALKSVNIKSDTRGWSYSDSQFKFELSAGTYTITIIPLISPSSVYSGAVLFDNNNIEIIGDTSRYNVSTPHTYTFTLIETTSLGLMFKVYDGAFYIMLNSGSSPLPYEPYGYKVPVTVSNGTDTLTTPIYLPEQIKMVGDEAEYIDYAEQKMHRVRKNLFNENLYNKNVVNYTLIYVPIYVGNVDYVTCSTTCPRQHDSSAPDGNQSRYIFILSGRVNTGALNAQNGVSNEETRTIQPSNEYVTIAYRKIESLNARPWEYQTMLNVGSTPLPYEPYIENTDLDVTLPALPTIKGTNTMSVDTEVQPSRMDIKGRIKSLT